MKSRLQMAVEALAVAAIHHGREGQIAFARILEIQKEREEREKESALLVAKAHAILAQNDAKKDLR